MNFKFEIWTFLGFFFFFLKAEKGHFDGLWLLLEINSHIAQYICNGNQK